MGLQGLHHCQTAVHNGGGDTIKVSQKKTEDVEEGSSSRKKQKRKEDKEIKAEFSLVVEEEWQGSGRSRSGSRSRGGPL